MKLYFQNKTSDLDEWAGFLLSVETSSKPMLRLHTALGAKMKLQADAQTLFWAHISDGYYGVNVLRTLPQSEHVNLLPHIHSADLMQTKHLDKTEQAKYWAKFFVKALQNAPLSPLYGGLWALDFCFLSKQYDQPLWLNRDHSKWCVTKAEDTQLLAAHDVYIDWAGCGNSNIINLFAQHAKPENVDRIKWWLKVAKEQALPPLLLWCISALDAYVLLDGHDRLQAALINGIAPTCLVLSSYTECASYKLDEDKQKAILHQLDIAEKKIAAGIVVGSDTIAGINSALVRSFDNRPNPLYRTRTVADLAAEQWLKETQAFKKQLKKLSPHVAIEQFHLMDV